MTAAAAVIVAVPPVRGRGLAPGCAFRTAEVAAKMVGRRGRPGNEKDAIRQTSTPLSIQELTFYDGANRDAAEAKAFVDVLNDGNLSAKERGQELIDLHRQTLSA